VSIILEWIITQDVCIFVLLFQRIDHFSTTLYLVWYLYSYDIKGCDSNFEVNIFYNFKSCSNEITTLYFEKLLSAEFDQESNFFRMKYHPIYPMKHFFAQTGFLQDNENVKGKP